jgi:hypothetical protein
MTHPRAVPSERGTADRWTPIGHSVTLKGATQDENNIDAVA